MIKINIVNKRPEVIGAPVIVCGNSDYVIEFTFDDEWNAAAEKIARFVYVQAGVAKSLDVPFTGDTVNVPVLSNTREVQVGVYAGDLQTTTPARIPCERSILCGDVVEGIVPETKETMLKELLETKDECLADINQRAKDLAGAIVNAATGEVVTVTDASDAYLPGLKLYGKTIQNGTPTPDAPVPLETVGADGNVAVTVVDKNLLSLPYHNSNNFTHNGIQYTVKPNGGVICNGTATAESLFTVKYLMTLPAGTYFLCGCPLASGGQLYLRTEDKGVIVRAKKEGAEFTLTKDDTFTIWVDIFTGTKVENVVFYPVICKKRQTLAISTPNGLPGIPVSSGGNYADENGQQWICDEIDFARGKYVQRVGEIVYNGTNIPFRDLTSANKYSAVVTDGRFLASYDCDKALCTHYPFAGFSNAASFLTKDKTFALYRHPTDLAVVAGGAYIYDTDFANAAELNAYLAENPMTVLYAMRTPIETDLTAEEIAQYSALHTNYPNTTIYNDEGAGMGVKYVADTKLYIDHKIAAISAAVLNV